MVSRKDSNCKALKTSPLSLALQIFSPCNARTFMDWPKWFNYRLESPTRQLEMTAAKDINLQSRAGGIEVVSLEDVKFRALDGSVSMISDSRGSNITFP